MLKFNWKGISLLGVLLLTRTSFAGLSKTFPTSPVTVVRIEAFTDVFTNINSTYTIQVDTWDVVADSYTYVYSNQNVYGWVTDTSTQPWVVKQTTWTIQEFIKNVAEQSRRQVENDILDKDVEQFMVFPDTSPPLGWLGYCAHLVNGKTTPIICP